MLLSFVAFARNVNEGRIEYLLLQFFYISCEIMCCLIHAKKCLQMSKSRAGEPESELEPAGAE